jgi:TonB family protein
MNIKTLGLSFLLLSPLITLHAQTPKTVAQVQPQWKTPPTLNYTNKDLKNQNRKTTLHIMGNPQGKIINTRIIQSSGIAALDQKVQHAVMASEFLPYPHVFEVTQSFEMTISPLQDNKIWLVKPYISYQNLDLQGKNRYLTLQITRDPKGFIDAIEILQSTGIQHLDEKIIGQVKDARLDPKTTPKQLTVPLSLSTQFNQQQSRKVKLKDDMPIDEVNKIWRHFPQIQYTQNDLDGQTRHLSFSLSFNAAGNLAKSTLTQSSGNSQLDAKIYNQIKTATLYSQHAPVTLNIPLVLTVEKRVAQ